MKPRGALLALTIALALSCDFTNVSEPPPYPEALADRVDWLRSNARPLTHIEPGPDDFADLMPLRTAIGDARVVLLGEQSHGDGTVFLMKARLIEFLHSELGFDVLAFESGLYDMDVAWRRIAAGESAASAMRSAVFSIWTGSREFQPTIEYVERAARSGRPLQLAGFDLQFTGTASRDSMVRELETALGRNGSNLPADTAWPAFRSMLQNLVDGSWYGTLPAELERARFRDALSDVQEEFAALAGTGTDPEASFWTEVLASTADQLANLEEYAQNGGQPTRPSGNRRDRRMGQNLVWLANERFRDRKIIVWAATYHIVREIERIELVGNSNGFSYEGVVTMGEVAAESLGDALYMLGFTAFTGSAGNWSNAPRPFSRALIPSLEWMFNEAGLGNAFLDFRAPSPGGEWLQSPVVAKPLGYVDMRAVWPRHLDGIIYNRDMLPSTRYP